MPNDEVHQIPNDEIQWYFYDAATDEVLDNVEYMWTEIRCDVETPRHIEIRTGRDRSCAEEN